MAEILVVDDEPDIAFMVAEYLGTRGHAVRMAQDGRMLRNAVAERAADLFVLDVNLPGENGFGLARWLREQHDPGIIMLTAADTPFDRVAALETGADDHLGKPFALAELEARIAAVLRRRRPAAAAQKPQPPGCLPFGRYVFDPRARKLRDAAGEPLPLGAMELDLVEAFARNAGRVLSRDELLDRAPPRGDEPFDRSIDSRVTRLRRRLEEDPAHPALIKTVRGVGYLHPRPARADAGEDRRRHILVQPADERCSRLEQR